MLYLPEVNPVLALGRVHRILCGADAGVVGHGKGGVDGHARSVPARTVNADAVDGEHAERIGQFLGTESFLSSVRPGGMGLNLERKW